jgi:hypothetical protein
MIKVIYTTQTELRVVDYTVCMSRKDRVEPATGYMLRYENTVEKRHLEKKRYEQCCQYHHSSFVRFYNLYMDM